MNKSIILSLTLLIGMCSFCFTEVLVTELFVDGSNGVYINCTNGSKLILHAPSLPSCSSAKANYVASQSEFSTISKQMQENIANLTKKLDEKAGELEKAYSDLPKNPEFQQEVIKALKKDPEFLKQLKQLIQEVEDNRGL